MRLAPLETSEKVLKFEQLYAFMIKFNVMGV